MKKQNMTTTSIRIRPDTLEMLEKIAEDKERKVSELMRLILEHYVKTNNL